MYVQNFFCIVFAKIIRDFGNKYAFLDDFSLQLRKNVTKCNNGLNS